MLRQVQYFDDFMKKKKTLVMVIIDKKKSYMQEIHQKYIYKKKSLYVGLFTCSLRLLCLIAYCDILKESDCYTTVEPTISGRVLQVYQISIFFFFIECDYQCQMLFYFCLYLDIRVFSRCSVFI